MENEQNTNLRKKITQKAMATAEATVYTLDNPYLSQEAKNEMEMWYQLPGNIMTYAFVLVAIWNVVVEPLRWSIIIGIPLMINVIIGLFNWYFYNKNLVRKCYLTFLHRWMLILVGITAASFLFYKDAIALAILSLLAPFGLLSPAELHMFLYAILANKYRMHPKYAFFKRFYGHVFTFEEVPTNKTTGTEDMEQHC